MNIAVEMRNIRKEFDRVVANDDITLDLQQGEIHALLGENGAGKSTLMNILFGLYQPDGGSIHLQGNEVRILNPSTASLLGIGMVHQHFKLVQTFTVVENIILGREPNHCGRIDMAEALSRTREISQRYGLDVDPEAKIEDLPIGMQQRVEILKMLYREANVLIFDEPTAALSPQEIDELMKIMRNLAMEGKSIFLITHKLSEIKAVADRCTVIRRGRLIGTVKVEAVTEEQMAEMMIGRSVLLKVEKKSLKPGRVLLRVDRITVLDQRKLPAVKNMSFEIRAGEILGVAGIDGNGQSELVEAIVGLKKLESGRIEVDGVEVNQLSVRKRMERGLAHVPADRQKHGLVLDFSLEDNMALEVYYREPYAKYGVLSQAKIREHAIGIMNDFDIRTGNGTLTPARALSGGNQQKAVIGREMGLGPQVLIAVQPTRGLDIGSIEYIRKRLVESRDEGHAVLLVSLDLDELLNMADRIVVLCRGEMIGSLEAVDADEKELGLMMTGIGKEARQ